jgi:hypothetical protein
MKPTKKTPRLGRPPDTERTKQTKDEERRAVADRLRAEFARLGWRTEFTAARRAGLRQGWVNDITNGRRDITRRDLRAFAKAGISADYLLGISKQNIPPNATRTKADLAADLAREAARLLTDQLSPPDGYRWVVDGNRALGACVAALRPHADAERALAAKLDAAVAKFNEIVAELPTLSPDERNRIANLAIAPLLPEPPEGGVHLQKIEDEAEARLAAEDAVAEARHHRTHHRRTR